jgi:hypothetical protein
MGREFLFRELNELAETHPQSRSELIGNLDSHANLSKFDGTYIGPVDSCLLRKLLLGKALFLSFLSVGHR